MLASAVATAASRPLLITPFTAFKLREMISCRLLLWLSSSSICFGHTWAWLTAGHAKVRSVDQAL